MLENERVHAGAGTGATWSQADRLNCHYHHHLTSHTTHSQPSQPKPTLSFMICLTGCTMLLSSIDPAATAGSRGVYRK